LKRFKTTPTNQTQNNTKKAESTNLFYLQYLKGLCFVMLCKNKLASKYKSSSNNNNNNVNKTISRSATMSAIMNNNNNNNNKIDFDYFTCKKTLLKPIENIPSEYEDDYNKNNSKILA